MKIYYLLLITLLLSASCKKSEDDDLSKTKMSAIVNGKSWATEYSRMQMMPGLTDSVLLIYGWHSDGSVIQIQVNKLPLQAGTYNFDTTLVNGIYASYSVTNTASANIATEGKLTIQRVDSDAVKGYFNFKTSNITVSQGQFVARKW